MVVLIGSTATGKSALEQEVAKRGILPKLTSHTDRPIRANETDGVDYYFTDTKTMVYKDLVNEFVETRTYDTEYGQWHYGLSKKEVDRRPNGIVVLDLDGAKELKAYMSERFPKEKVITIFIACSGKIRLLRSLARDNCDEKKCDEICRRYLDDKGWEQEAKEYCDYVIWNEDSDDFENAIKFIESLKKGLTK